MSAKSDGSATQLQGEPAALPAVSDRALLLDAAVIAVISVAICVASQRLIVMTVLVAVVMLARFIAFSRLPTSERGSSMRTELLFFGVCTVLGAFNDFNSVVRHRIYDYDVPVFFATLTTIPLWMLLYWGMILRFVTTLTRWGRFAARHRPRAELRLLGKSSWAPLIVALALVLATRQCIYRLYGDPLWSWVPFAVAIGIYVALFELTRRDLWLAGLFLLGGPLIEVAYIQLGSLHRYHLGWFGGVPLWIVLWWVLAVLVWQDMSVRLLAALRGLELGEDDTPAAVAAEPS